MEGVFVVTTADGLSHRLDLDRRQITRTAEISPGVRAAVESVSASLLAVATCRVGAPMVLLIDRGTPGVWFTRRATAAVVIIEQIPHPPRPTRSVTP